MGEDADAEITLMARRVGVMPDGSIDPRAYTGLFLLEVLGQLEQSDMERLATSSARLAERIDREMLGDGRYTAFAILLAMASISRVMIASILHSVGMYPPPSMGTN